MSRHNAIVQAAALDYCGRDLMLPSIPADLTHFGAVIMLGAVFKRFTFDTNLPWSLSVPSRNFDGRSLRDEAGCNQVGARPHSQLSIMSCGDLHRTGVSPAGVSHILCHSKKPRIA